MDILLTGGSGQVGREILALSWPAGATLHAPDRATLDLADDKSIERALAWRRYDAIISCGAYTAVDRAESEVALAWRVNALAPAILAAHAGRQCIPIVHLSTDYVFDGVKAEPYREDDPVGPINVYGASKEGGEQAIRTASPNHAILRTAWVMGPRGRNFLTTMLRLARERDGVTVVSDQRGSPTVAADLAAGVRDVTLARLRGEGAPGTYHLVNAGEGSWSEVAEAVFEASARRGGPQAQVRPIRTEEYPTAARRPANSRLATDKIADVFRVRLRHWREALADVTAAPLTD